MWNSTDSFSARSCKNEILRDGKINHRDFCHFLPCILFFLFKGKTSKIPCAAFKTKTHHSCVQACMFSFISTGIIWWWSVFWCFTGTIVTHKFAHWNEIRHFRNRKFTCPPWQRRYEMDVTLGFVLEMGAIYCIVRQSVWHRYIFSAEQIYNADKSMLLISRLRDSESSVFPSPCVLALSQKLQSAAHS